MGIGKILFFIVAPIGGMTIAAFSLRKELPRACRLFGNYIGLYYVYFKSAIKILKPQDHMTYQMIDIARKASQQSQALKRQLRNTVKKMKFELKQKKQEVFQQFEKDFPVFNDQQNKINQINMESITENKMKQSGNLIIEMQRKRKQILQKRSQKKKANKFFDQL